MSAPLKTHDPVSIASNLPLMEFRKLASFNAGHVGVFRCEAGVSPWERHPDDDELLYVLDGEADLIVMMEGDPIATTVEAGSLFVVPRGRWHRHHVRGHLHELYVTPGRTEHSNAEDPRTEEV
jgi:quercetin dioxygenase-like cupin family protein